MSNTYKDSQKSKAARKGRERHISVRAVRRDPPDLRKLSRALITLALAEAAAEAEAEAQASGATTREVKIQPPTKSSKSDGSEGSDV
jgi:hypothetical protein